MFPVGTMVSQSSAQRLTSNSAGCVCVWQFHNYSYFVLLSAIYSNKKNMFWLAQCIIVFLYSVRHTVVVCYGVYFNLFGLLLYHKPNKLDVLGVA